MIQNLVIIGSGAAGYTAAIYAGRAQLKPVVFEGFEAKTEKAICRSHAKGACSLSTVGEQRNVMERAAINPANLCMYILQVHNDCLGHVGIAVGL